MGRCARIGGNSVVTRDVPEGQTVVGIPAKAIKQASRDSQFEAYGVNDMPAEDVQSRTISALFAELEVLRARLNKLASEQESVKQPAAPEGVSENDVQDRVQK